MSTTMYVVRPTNGISKLPADRRSSLKNGRLTNVPRTGTISLSSFQGSSLNSQYQPELQPLRPLFAGESG